MAAEALLAPSVFDQQIEYALTVLEAMSEDQRAAYLRAVPEVAELVERVFASRRSVGYRTHPASLASHLDPSYRRWGYIELLSQSFADAFHGIDTKQIWNMPSQYGKTTLLMMGVVWALDADPTRRIMYVSYDVHKAVKDAGDARDFAEKHAEHLSFRLKRDRRARGTWQTEQGGGLYATGINGGITGYPADALLLDDLLKGWQAAHSQGQRDFVWDVYRAQLRLRIQSLMTPLLVVGTRWHELDHFRKLAANEDAMGDQWKIVRLATIAEPADPTNTDPLLRGADPLGREPGQILEPERFPAAEVRARHIALGSYLTAAMEQQRPAPEEGSEIKRAWFKLAEQMPPKADAWLSSWDMKLKDKEAGDFNVGQVWCRTGTDYWLMDQVRGQWGQALTRVAVALMAVRWPQCKRHVIESAGFGPEVMQQLREPAKGYVVSDEIAGELGMTVEERAKVQALIRRGVTGLVPQAVKGSKSVRARAVAPMIEAGNVHLPANAGFTTQLLDECAAFGGGSGAHDDQVDAMSQALSRLSRSRASVQPPPQRRIVQPPPGVVKPIRQAPRQRRATSIVSVAAARRPTRERILTN